MSKRKFSGNVNGKGYYIALVLCAIAIGVSGYLYYANENEKPQQLQSDMSTADVAATDGGVQAVATQPDGSTIATEPAVTPKKPAKTASPVAGSTVAPYSMDALCYNQTTRDWRVHDGVDIAAETGTKVCAAADGEVYTVYDDETMGMTVVIRHDGGYTTKYASLAQEVAVKPGDKVTVGQAIGTVGNTALLENALGEHIHFSVSCNGAAVDPAEFLS